MTAPVTIPPQNREAEMSVLGAILQDAEALKQCSAVLCPEDFFLDAHGKIFAAAIDVACERGEVSDLITVTNELRRRGKLEEVGSAAFLASLVAAVPTTANVTHHARIIREKAEARRVAALAHDLAEAASADDGWGDKLSGLLTFYTTRADGASTSLTPLLLAGDIQAAPVSYSIEGMVPRKMAGVLSGKDKRGKTLLAIEMGRALLDGEPFLGEFPTVLSRTVAAFLFDDPDSLTIQRLKDAGIYGHPRLYLCTASMVDLSDPKKALADMLTEVKRVGAEFVIIDALYQFIPTTSGEAANDPSRMGPVMAAINRISTEAGATVLLIAHDTKAGGDVAGSYVIRASSKFILRLTLPKQEEEPEDDGPLTPDRILKLESKLVAAQSWRLSILGDRERYEGWAFHGTTLEANVKAAYTAVATYLEEHTETAFTVSQLSHELRRREQVVRAAVQSLVKGGKVSEISREARWKKGRPTKVYQWAIIPPDGDTSERGREEKSKPQVPATVDVVVSEHFSSRNPALGDGKRDGNSQSGSDAGQFERMEVER